ncbi:MAG: response regulator transcription factor [Christensenellales bacterium]
MFKILVAEDDANLRKVVVDTLKNENYTVVGAENGSVALNCFCDEKFDLVITDVMMPQMDGNELCASIRNIAPDTPILMLTALESIDDKEKSFNSGADDYLTKPFALKELLLRIKALLRRYGEVCESKIVLSHTILDYSANCAVIDGKQINLTKKEFLLLFKLLSNPNKIFSREQLMDEIWGYESESADRTVDTHIKWLRDKTENEDFQIITMRGLGYKAVLNEKKA